MSATVLFSKHSWFNLWHFLNVTLRDCSWVRSFMTADWYVWSNDLPYLSDEAYATCMLSKILSSEYWSLASLRVLLLTQAWTHLLHCRWRTWLYSVRFHLLNVSSFCYQYISQTQWHFRTIVVCTYYVNKLVRRRLGWVCLLTLSQITDIYIITYTFSQHFTMTLSDKHDLERAFIEENAALPSDQRYPVQLTSEQYDRLFRSPPYRPVHKLGNPNALGVITFILVQAPTAFIQMGWGSTTAAANGVLFGPYYMLGGLGLIISGVMEWVSFDDNFMHYSSDSNEYRQIVGNTFPSVVYITFGGNWYAILASSSPRISHILHKAWPWGPSRPSTWNCIHISWRNQLTRL